MILDIVKSNLVIKLQILISKTDFINYWKHLHDLITESLNSDGQQFHQYQ